MTFYAGPKDFDTLAAIDRNLVKAINFGMFSVIVVPLLRSLNWIHSYVGNYGWAILLLTVFINTGALPAEPGSRGVDAEDAGEVQPETKGDSGALREAYQEPRIPSARK